MLLIRGAKQILTLRGPRIPRRGAALRDLGIVQDGAILVRDGRIEDVGPSRRVENLAAARKAEDIIEAPGRVVLPAFVDSNTHLVFAQPPLDYFERKMLESDFVSTPSCQESIVRDAHPISRLEYQARAHALRMVRHGTVSVEVKSGYSIDLGGESKILRAVKALSGKPLDTYGTVLAGCIMPPRFVGNPDGYIDHMCAEVLPLLRRRRLAWFADIVCDTALFSPAHIRRYLESARTCGYLLKLHLTERAVEGSAELACHLGALSVDHVTGLRDGEISAMISANTVATLIPGAGFFRGGSSYPPARALIDAGAPVALATGFSPDASPTWSMQMVISIACTHMRMTPAEAISAATINGAHALGIAAQTGSLEPGKNADLLIMNASDYRELPFYFGGNHVQMTFRRGQPVYREMDRAELQ